MPGVCQVLRFPVRCMDTATIVFSSPLQPGFCSCLQREDTSSLFLTHSLDSIYSLPNRQRRKDPDLIPFFPGSIFIPYERVMVPARSNYLISHFEAVPLHALTKTGAGLLGECLQQWSGRDSFLLLLQIFLRFRQS